MRVSPSLVPIYRISKETLTRLSDDPVFVLPVYGLVLLPLALYVFHDIVDYRWRPIHGVIRYNIAYLLLYVAAATFLVGYAIIQWIGSDFKEVGAATVALILATYRVWTLFRLTAIITAHRRLVMVLKACNERLDELSLKPKPFQPIKYFLFRKPPPGVYKRHLYLSSCLFDDTYPGHSARIRWLSMYSKVHRNDVNGCAARVAVWMRVVLGDTDVRIWDEMTDSKVGAFETGNSGKLYETLLNEFNSTPLSALPADVSHNPGEELINLTGSVDPSHLRKLGAGIFWFAARVRDEEFGQIIADMPASWMNQTEHTGKQMMFEMGSILMLSGMKIPDGSVGRLLMLTKDDLKKSMLEEESEMIWKLITDVCIEAMTVMYLRDQDGAKSSKVVEKGASMMRDKFQRAGGTTEGLCFHMIYMIRRAYFGAYIVESVLGTHMNHIAVAQECSQLFPAEIAFSLYHVLATLEVFERNLLSKVRFETEKKSMSRLACDGRPVDYGDQACPANEFLVFFKLAKSAAQNVYQAFFRAFEHDLDLGNIVQKPTIA